jgi:hypothetical protein
MAEHELDLRLRAVARELDADAPAFDLGLLSVAPPRRIRGRVVALVCIVALAAVAGAPAAISALQQLFDVDEVPELGPLAPGVAPPYAGRLVPVDAVQASVPFRVRMISSLGTPNSAHVRDDIAGGMATIAYRDGRILLTQWRTTDVQARIAIAPVDGSAEEVTAGGLPALWIEGTARGTFTLVGADGAVHRESFDVGAGVLLWKQFGMTLLLQGAGSRVEAIKLAAEVDR